MNPNTEPGFLIRDFVAETGMTFDGRTTGVDEFLHWVNSYPERGVAWGECREFNEFSDLEQIEFVMQDEFWGPNGLLGDMA